MITALMHKNHVGFIKMMSVLLCVKAKRKHECNVRIIAGWKCVIFTDHCFKFLPGVVRLLRSKPRLGNNDTEKPRRVKLHNNTVIKNAKLVST